MLSTPRLVLVPLAPEHLPLAVELDGDPEVMRFLTGRASAAEQAAADHERRLLSARDVPGLGYWAGALRERPEGAAGAGARPVGSGWVGWWALERVLGPDGLVRPGEAELGYRLRRAHWRRGLASEGARALVAHGFADLGLRRVLAWTMAVNAASRATMAAVGLRHERTLHLEFDDPLPGTEHGEVEYALDRQEWEASAGAGGG